MTTGLTPTFIVGGEGSLGPGITALVQRSKMR